MSLIRKSVELKERLAGPPSRRAAYYTLVQAAYACLAGAFEMPMAFRLAGRIDLVAFVYAFYYATLFGGFALGMVLVREGGASSVYRLAIGLWAALSLGAAALFPLLRGILALVGYFFVRGLAEGLYWAARHRAFLWAVGDSRRDRFALRLQSLVVSLSVVLPLIGGFAITYLGPRFGTAPASGGLPSGYVPVFIFTGCVMVVSLACSPKLAIGRSPLSFRATFAVFGLREAGPWRAYLCLTGFAGGILSIAAGVQTFGLLQTEFRIGALNAGIALLSGLLFLSLGKLLAGKKGLRKGGVFVGAIADFTSRSVYAIAPTTRALVVKAFLDALAVPLKSLFGENVQFALIERLSLGEPSGDRAGAWSNVDMRSSGDVRSSGDEPARLASDARGGAQTSKAARRASVAELYLFREFLLWMTRLAACVATGLLLRLFSRSGSSDAPRLTARVLIALAAPVALVEYLFVTSFARANAAAVAASVAAASAGAATPVGLSCGAAGPVGATTQVPAATPAVIAGAVVAPVAATQVPAATPAAAALSTAPTGSH